MKLRKESKKSKILKILYCKLNDDITEIIISSYSNAIINSRINELKAKGFTNKHIKVERIDVSERCDKKFIYIVSYDPTREDSYRVRISVNSIFDDNDCKSIIIKYKHPEIIYHIPAYSIKEATDKAMALNETYLRYKQNKRDTYYVGESIID